MRELRNSNGFNLDWLALIDLYLATIWLIFEIDQSGLCLLSLLLLLLLLYIYTNYSVTQPGLAWAWLGCDNITQF